MFLNFEITLISVIVYSISKTNSTGDKKNTNNFSSSFNSAGNYVQNGISTFSNSSGNATTTGF